MTKLVPLVAVMMVLGFFACKKDIAPIPEESPRGHLEASQPGDSTTTDTTDQTDTTGITDITDSTETETTDTASKKTDTTKKAGGTSRKPAPAPPNTSNNNNDNNNIERSPLVHTAVTTNINGNISGFWQSVPAGYSKSSKSYPLILFIHGIGELGTNLSKMNCCGLPKHIKNKSFPSDFEVKGKHYSFIVMSPQFKRRPSAADIQSVIEFAKKRFRVDSRRIYITGLSMGGGSTWDYSAVYGQQAAAIVPVCGGTKPTNSLARNIASKNVAVWTIHSTGDRVVPAQWARNWIDWIDKSNPSVAAKTKLTVWKGVDHNSTWAKAFNPSTKVDGMNIYEWMLQYEKG